MKRAKILFCILVLGTTMLYGQTGPRFKYEKDIIDLGTLYTGELDVIKVDIAFANLGDLPLILTNVRGCCGTRVTNWPKEPLNPEDKGTISIEFRLNPTAQNISRTITTSCNDSEKATQIIRIIGKVEEGKSSAQN